MPGPRPLTSTERANILKHNQGMQVYVLIDTPPAIFKARVDRDFAGNYNRLVEIPFDGVTLGAHTDIRPDMTVLIGTSEGAADVGTARVRKTPSSSILYIGETSEIKIADDQYITVVAGYEPWPKHLFIESNGVVKMDYDVLYSNQHSQPDPTPVFGCDRVVWMEGESVEAAFDASASYCIDGSSITGYFWSCAGAEIDDDEIVAPTITFEEPGRYLVYCQVSTDVKSFTGVVVVHVLDSADNPTYQPLHPGVLGTLNYDDQTGGHSFDVVCYYDEPLPVSQVRDHAKVIVFAKDYIDKKRIQQGPEEGLENYILAGWIVGETIGIGKRPRAISFEVQGPQYFLDQELAFPAGLEDTQYANNGGGAPNRWIEMQNLTVDKVVWHYAHWRSTLTRMTAIRLTGDARKAAQIPAPFGSIWSQLQQMTWNVILARPCFDMYGRLWVEIDGQLRSDAERDEIPVVMSLTLDDLAEGSEIMRRVMNEVGYVELSGVIYAGRQGTAVGAISPGDAPARFGGAEVVENLALSSQAQVIELAGRYAGWRNSPAEITAEMSYNRFVGIAPAQWLELPLDGSETARGLTGTLRLLPRRIQARHDPRNGKFLMTVTLETEGVTWPAVKKIFAGSDGGPPRPGGGDDPPPPPPPEPPPEPMEGSDTDVVCATGGEVRTTGDFDQSSPAWADKTGAIGSTIVDFALVDDDTALVITAAAIYKTEDLQEAAPTWTAVWIAANDWDPGLGDTPTLKRIAVTTGYIYVLANCSRATVYDEDAGELVEKSVAYLLRSMNGGITWTVHTIETDDVVSENDYYFDTPIINWTKKAYSEEPWEYFAKGHFTVLGRNKFSVYIETIRSSWPYHSGIDFTIPILGGWGTTWPKSLKAKVTGSLFPADCLALEWAATSRRHHVALGDDIYEWNPINNVLTNRQQWESDGLISQDAELICDFTFELIEVNGVPENNLDDIGRSLAANGAVVYVGVKEKIVVSRDAGFTWSDYITDHSANDILIPGYGNSAARNVLYWSTDGSLHWATGYSSGEAEKGAALLYENNARKVPYRIANDPDDGWPIFALANMGAGSSLYKLSPGSGGVIVSQDLLLTDISNARGLRLYRGANGRRLFYLDGTDIHYSDGDDGESWSQKKGDWTGYASPVRIEALSP